GAEPPCHAIAGGVEHEGARQLLAEAPAPLRETRVAELLNPAGRDFRLIDLELIDLRAGSGSRGRTSSPGWAREFQRHHDTNP
ncbi:MAG TPA: hypothetical protein VH913_26900, partial [Hyphomicrobiaceae bacterium]